MQGKCYRLRVTYGSWAYNVFSGCFCILFCCKLTYRDSCTMTIRAFKQAEIQSRHYYFNKPRSVWPCNKNPRMMSCQCSVEAERRLSTSSTFTETGSHGTLISRKINRCLSLQSVLVTHFVLCWVHKNNKDDMHPSLFITGQIQMYQTN